MTASQLDVIEKYVRKALERPSGVTIDGDVVLRLVARVRALEDALRPFAVCGDAAVTMGYDQRLSLERLLSTTDWQGNTELAVADVVKAKEVLNG